MGFDEVRSEWCVRHPKFDTAALTEELAVLGSEFLLSYIDNLAAPLLLPMGPNHPLALFRSEIRDDVVGLFQSLNCFSAKRVDLVDLRAQ